MEFIVTHLTRMEFPNICVAGIDAQTMESVRITVPYPQALTCYMHARKGGPFDLGARLDIGDTVPRMQPPEMEDRQITLHRIRKLGYLSKESLWQLLAEKARNDIPTIFGPTLERTRQTYSSPPNTGLASLGFLKLSGRTKLSVREYEDRTKIMLALLENGSWLSLPVTDLRLHILGIGFPVDKTAVDHTNTLLQSASATVLSLGLTRVWSGRHWLQVNNIHTSPDA